MSQSEHAKIHAIAGRNKKNLQCSCCNIEFEREVRQIKKDQKDFYCSRSCGAKSYGRGRSKMSKNNQKINPPPNQNPPKPPKVERGRIYKRSDENPDQITRDK